MKYAIFHIIRGKPKLILQDLKKEIENEFDLKKIEFTTFPHMTIKYDFETDSIELIEEIMDNFCSEYASFEISLSGVGSFDKKVIFLKVEENLQLVNLYYDLYKRLRKIKWITWESFEGENCKPHITVAHKQLNENNFTQILEYLRRKNIEMSINFNNLAIAIIETKKEKFSN